MASLAVRVDTNPSNGRRLPPLVVSATLGIPAQDPAETALTLMRGAISTGLRPGIVDADLSYFDNTAPEKLHQPASDIGFTPSTDYRGDRTDALRNRQAFSYGSPKWMDFHNGSRRAVEAVSAWLKQSPTFSAPAVSGFTATQVLLTMTLATYNLREIERANARASGA